MRKSKSACLYQCLSRFKNRDLSTSVEMTAPAIVSDASTRWSFIFRVTFREAGCPSETIKRNDFSISLYLLRKYGFAARIFGYLKKRFNRGEKKSQRFLGCARNDITRRIQQNPRFLDFSFAYTRNDILVTKSKKDNCT